MKLNYLLIGICCLFGCNDSSEAGPNEAVIQSFATKYPEASKVEWENKRSYFVAEFIHEQKSAEAWFDHEGQWYFTKTELTGKEQLPATVRDAFGQSEYANWIVDDIDRLERQQAETVYVIEVKKEALEYDLYYTTDGTLVKAVPDKQDEEFLPQPVLPEEIHHQIDQKYPGARIVEYETEHQRIEVDIIYEGRGQEVVFNLSYQWLHTHYDVRKENVEPLVLQALAASDYKDYEIDDIEWYETPTQSYYLFELEKGHSEINVAIRLDGQLQVK